MNTKLTRRAFNLLMAGGSLGGDSLLQAALNSGGIPGAGKSVVSNVVPNAHCFVINGKPEFIISGAIHYQRCPHELWRDRMLRAKRAGVNCIETYIAWNFHEAQEGRFDFEGDRNISLFIDTCQELGMYCFLRVGPFVCGEWDAGGYPGWLIAKPGVEFRTMNTVALPYIRRWFEQLIPEIAKRQVTKGGPVILVQAENEWLYCNRPGGMEYLQFLIQTLRDLGIEVPITDCNHYVVVPNSLKTIGFSEQDVKDSRERFPNVPPLVYELYPDWGEIWGQPRRMPNSYPPGVRQQTMQALSLRTMFNYYTFHGGTNFGFWACNTWKSDHSFITTRYYWSSPVEEGGALDEMYFAVKGSNLLANNFCEFFCQADAAASPATVQGPVLLTALESPQGKMLFVLPLYPYQETTDWDTSGRSPYLFSLTEDGPGGELAHQAGVLRLASGKLLPLAENCSRPMMLPLDFKLDDACHIDFSNATVFGYGGTSAHRVLAVRGDAGRQGVISVNGRVVEFVFPAGEPALVPAGETRILAVGCELANRTWFAEGRIVVGPEFVGESKDGKHECWLGEASPAVHIISTDGTYHRSQPLVKPRFDEITRLAQWHARGFEEIDGGGEGWQGISGPKSVEELGTHYGYVWYRASYDSDRARRASLFPTDVADRLHVFLRGRSVGVLGRGPGATRDPLPVELQGGRNEFIFLCDNMGRTSEGKVNDRKGITGPLYIDADPVPLGAGEWTSLSSAPTESWEFLTHRCYMGETEARFSEVRVRVNVGKDRGALLALRWVPQYTWVYASDHLVGEHGGDDPLLSGFCFKNYTLDSFLESGRIELQLVFWGDPMADWADHVRLFTYATTNALDRWRFKAWEDPKNDVAKARASLPTWWDCEIPKPSLPSPLFLVTEGLSKGQLYLNGIAAGRYWEIGPQHSLYLPEPWFKPMNSLAVFDEEGKRPEQVYIVRDPRCPIHKVLL